jgi:murein DD-endopeptidase MepM/ murein hydrolase activator NlpD
MKQKKRPSILIFPPGSGRLRTIRLPKSFLIIFCVLICMGFAGYFIPFNNFTLDVVEMNQKRYLDEQNKHLLQTIRPMRKFLDNLNDEIEKLERKKQKISRLLGISDIPNRNESRLKNSKPSLLSLDDLVGVVAKNYNLYASFTESKDKKPDKDYFDVIPVVMPILDKPLICAHFGKENDPFTQYNKMHFGVDLIAPRGSPVIATASGVVTKVEDSRIWGRRIWINHSYGFSTVYAHLGAVEVFTGKKVKKGDRIAVLGHSGLTTGMHVHYEILHNGKPENPEEYFFPKS